MTLKVRVKQLEEEQAVRDARERERCTCELVILEGRRPTTEQVAVLARNGTCRADHRSRGFSVVEVPPPPNWMKTRTAEPVSILEVRRIGDGDAEILEEYSSTTVSDSSD